MELNEVEIITTHKTRSLALDADVDAAQRAIGFALPDGYREYVKSLGRGVIGLYLMVAMPHQIIADLAENREQRIDNWFWDEAIITHEQAIQAVQIAITEGGDRFISHPDNPDRIIVLPRDFDHAFQAGGGGLLAAIEWLYTEGVALTICPPDERDWRRFSA